MKAAQVESYLGFYFATMDADAPSLHDYLGDVGRTGLGMICANGDVEVIDGVQKNVIDCNWKIAVDNLFDWYHVHYSHASAGSAGFVNIAAHPASEEPAGDAGRIRPRDRRPGHPAERAGADRPDVATRSASRRLARPAPRPAPAHPPAQARPS